MSTASLMTTEEAVEYLRLANRQALYDLVHRSGLPTLRCGRSLRFRRADVDKWLAR